MRGARRGALAATLLLSGCGSGAQALAAHASPAALLTVDQLVSPDFAVDVAAHSVPAADVAARAATSVSSLQADGWMTATQVDFFRQDGNLAVLNGPIEVTDTAERFATAGGAAAAFTVDVAHLDTRGGTALSTGALGDEAHATQRTAVVATVSAVEFTVEWRVGSVLDVLVVRGRDGGTRLLDALLLAHAQTTTQLGLSTPSP